MEMQYGAEGAMHHGYGVGTNGHNGQMDAAGAMHPSGSVDPSATCKAVYICDLTPGIPEWDLWTLLSQYGSINAFERINEGSDCEGVSIEYGTREAAEEVLATMNHARVQGRHSRCFTITDLELIRRTIDSGHRLLIESLDTAISSSSLYDVMTLFGTVPDCKVELDEASGSRGYGFAHFAKAEDAAKAMIALNGMQIGDSVVKVRNFEWKDLALFTACDYSPHTGMGLSADAAYGGGAWFSANAPDFVPQAGAGYMGDGADGWMGMQAQPAA